MTALEELQRMEELAALEAAMKKGSGKEQVTTGLTRAKDAIVSGGKSLGRGFLSGLAGLAEGAAAFNYADRMGRTVEPGREMTAAVEKMLPIPDSESTFEKLARKGLEGVGGSFAVPVPGAMAANTFAGGVSGVTGELGRSYGESLGPKGELAGQVIGGALGGGLAGFLAGPKQSVAQADIRRELSGLPPSQWRQAEENVGLFKSVNAPTATLAEAFPGKPRIAVLASNAANAKGGEALAQQLSQRETDLQNLGEQFLNRLGPEVDPNRVANAATDAATSNILLNKRQASQQVTNTLAGINVPDKDVFDVYTALQNVASTAERATIRDAYSEVASRLLNPQGQPITNLQELSYAIKDLKDGMKNPLAPPKGGTKAMDQAIQAVENAFRTRFPAYDKAMTAFAQDQQALQGIKAGPIGSLADKNPLTAGQTPFSRLQGLTTANSPATISQTVGTLGSPLATMGNPANPEAIARALMQQKLAKGSADPGKTVRGMAGSGEDAKLDALIFAAGKNPEDVKAPLQAADQLQTLSPATSRSGFPEMRSAQAVIRPFRTIDMMMTGKTERDTQREIARYLAKPTISGLRELQNIAMFDPNLRRQLTLLAALRPGLFAQPENKE